MMNSREYNPRKHFGLPFIEQFPMSEAARRLLTAISIFKPWVTTIDARRNSRLVHKLTERNITFQQKNDLLIFTKSISVNSCLELRGVARMFLAGRPARRADRPQPPLAQADRALASALRRGDVPPEWAAAAGRAAGRAGLSENRKFPCPHPESIPGPFSSPNHSAKIAVHIFLERAGLARWASGSRSVSGRHGSCKLEDRSE